MITVLDAKWKLLSAAQQNYGISQADMYQMYAYHKNIVPTGCFGIPNDGKCETIKKELHLNRQMEF